MDGLLFIACELGASFLPGILLLLFLRHRHSTGLHHSRHWSRPHRYYPVMLLFGCYIIAVFHFTGVGTLYDGLLYQWEIQRGQVNLFPFSNEIDVVAYVLNILLFIPFGIFVPFLWDKQKQLWRTLSASLTFSLLIELSQLWNNRSTDIDDLLMNTLGGCIGFVLYQAIRTLLALMARSQNQTRSTAGLSSANPSFWMSGGELCLYILVLFAGRFFCFNEIGIAKRLYGF